MAIDAGPDTPPPCVNADPRLAPATAPLPRKLSEELAELRRHSMERALTLRDAIAVLGGRAYTLLLILLSLPFITPIPLPGLSTPFGLAVGLIALRLALKRKPWLPERLLSKPIPPVVFGKIFEVAAWVLRLLEKFLRPRFAFATAEPVLPRLHAVLMLLAATVLLLPLPIPFTNTFPAWAIILVAAGLLERDGLFILAGYVVFAAGALYFFLLGEATQRLLVMAKEWLLSWW
jgi:hypothetical protein